MIPAATGDWLATLAAVSYGQRSGMKAALHALKKLNPSIVAELPTAPRSCPRLSEDEHARILLSFHSLELTTQAALTGATPADGRRLKRVLRGVAGSRRELRSMFAVHVGRRYAPYAHGGDDWLRWMAARREAAVQLPPGAPIPPVEPANNVFSLGLYRTYPNATT